MELLGAWLESLNDERMELLRRFIFEVELCEMEELKDTLYKYGGCLTEKNYFGRKFFEKMAVLLLEMEQNRRSALR